MEKKKIKLCHCTSENGSLRCKLVESLICCLSYVHYLLLPAIISYSLHPGALFKHFLDKHWWLSCKMQTCNPCRYVYWNTECQHWKQVTPEDKMDPNVGYISRRKILGASRFVNIEQTEKSRHSDSRHTLTQTWKFLDRF